MSLKRIAVTLLALFASSALALTEREQWEAYKVTYNKKYTPLEEPLRYEIFSANLRHAEQLQQAETGTATYGVTPFMDLSPKEFRAKYLMPKELADNTVFPNGSVVELPDPLPEIPTSFDWRDASPAVITPVYNQEQCGSCWAFSATETIESFWALAGNTLTSLSMQQIVDCDTTAYGCNGGWTYLAYQYVEQAGGIDTYSSYPYRGVNGRCAFKSADVAAKISGWSYVTKTKDETAMATFLATTGPISVCVDASSWQYYTGGILKNCGQQIDHCVQATGYSVDGSTPYWIVRNSWGTSWGQQGYLYVYRGSDTCAIAQMPTSVTA